MTSLLEITCHDYSRSSLGVSTCVFILRKHALSLLSTAALPQLLLAPQGVQGRDLGRSRYSVNRPLARV